ncbi:MAG TPA: tetratricopeptide repeat protein [Polyangiaceae bacterium]|nr:tetratricopeptide repeat protein [Polyangiaceae bacterium]
MNTSSFFVPFRRSRLAALALVGFSALALPARAQPLDDEISDFAADVMSDDYAAKRYSAARKKLASALKKCGKKSCSRQVRAELQRDLGLVYFALGKKRLARRSFQKAIELDPNGYLEPELADDEASEAYRALGGHVGDAERVPEIEGEDEEGESAADEAPPPPHDARGPKHGWFSLTMQQDLLLHSETRPVCGSNEYACFSGGNEYAGPIWPAYGNRIEGGLAFATRRVLVGFDWLFGKNFQLGARFGVAFGGGPTAGKTSKFTPAHGELRVAYYFGRNPFASAGVRPYFALGGGMAEVQSKLAVDFYRDAAAYNQMRQDTVDAWRTSGRGFVAPTLGTQFAFSRNTAIALELRMMVMLGTTGLAPAGSVGFVQGL